MGNEVVAPHAGRSGAGVQATVRSTRKEPRKSPSVCTAPSWAGETRAPRRSPSPPRPPPPRPLQLLSGRKSGGGAALDAQAQRTEHGEQRRAQRPVGAPVEARRPGSQRRKRERRGLRLAAPGEARRAAPASSLPDSRRLCWAPAPGSAGRPPGTPAGHLSASASLQPSPPRLGSPSITPEPAYRETCARALARPGRDWP